MNKKMKKQIIIIITSIVLLIIAFLINDKLSVVFFLFSYIIVGHKIIYKAFRNIIRGKVFDEIVAGSITTRQVESSDFYKQIEERVNFLPLLEQLLDSNDTVFKYNKKANIHSMIDADYLMKNNMEDRNLYLFLSQGSDDRYFCRSFFPEEKMDYTKNQASWTMLYKKKRNLSTGEERILYDRLIKKRISYDS